MPSFEYAGKIEHICFDPQNNILYTAGDKGAMVWAVGTELSTASVLVNDCETCALLVLPSGAVVVGFLDQRVMLFGEDGQCTVLQKQYNGTSDTARHAKVRLTASADGSKIAWPVWTVHAKVILFNAHSKAKREFAVDSQYFLCEDVHLSACGKWLGVVSSNTTTYIWSTEVADESPMMQLRSHCFNFSLAGDAVAYAQGNEHRSSIHFAAIAHIAGSGTPPAVIPPVIAHSARTTFHGTTCIELCRSADTSRRTLFASGGEDAVVMLWEISNNLCTLLRSFLGYQHSISTLAFSADGSMLASTATPNPHKFPGVNDGTVRIWNVATESATPAAQQSSARPCCMDLCYSPQHNLILVSTEANAVELWRTGRMCTSPRAPGRFPFLSSQCMEPGRCCLFCTASWKLARHHQSTSSHSI